MLNGALSARETDFRDRDHISQNYVDPTATAEDVRRDVLFDVLSGGQVDLRDRDAVSKNYTCPVGTSAELDAACP